MFSEHCARCHGGRGEGTVDGPVLIGRTALPHAPRSGARVRTTRFDTIDEISNFVRENMPADAPGTLRPDEYDAVVAYCLAANQVSAHERRSGQ